MKCKKNICSKEEKKCLSCGADHNHLRLLNPKGEEKGGVVNFSFAVKNAGHILMIAGSMKDP